MAMGLATPVFIGTCAALQLALASRLLRRPKALQAVAGALFLLNGLAAAVLAARSATTERAFDLWADLADVPTGMLLLGFGALALGNQPLATTVRERRSSLGVLAGLVVAGMAATATAYATVGPATDAWLTFYAVYAAAPVYLGYALIVWAGARQLRRADSGFALWGLLVAGFGARATEFAGLYGLTALRQIPSAPSWGLANWVNSLSAVVLLAACLAVTAWLAAAALVRRRGGLTMPLAGLGLGWLVGAVEMLRPVDLAVFPGYFLTVLTLYFVRPILVGAAFDRRAVAVGLAEAGAASALFLLLKLLVSPAIGLSSSGWGPVDLAFVALALVLVLALKGTVFRQTLTLRTADAAIVAPSRSATWAERLGVFLLVAWNQSGGQQWSTKAAIHAGVGIRENNVAAELDRLQAAVRRAGAWPPGASSIVEVASDGLRGRKRYRLTAAGAQAVAALLERPPTAGRPERGQDLATPNP